MTEDKKDPDDLDIDWDRALSEWENTSFVPEVAKDILTDKPAALAGSGRPLYRPPTVSPAVRPKRPVAPPVPQVPRWSPEDEDEDEDAAGATRVQQVPEELLRSRGDSEGPAAAPEASPSVPPLSTETDEDDIESASLLEEIEEADQPTDTIATEAEPQRAHAVLLVPKVRQYDPTEVTAVAKEAGLAHTRKSLLSQLTGEAPPTAQPPTMGAPLPDARSWSNEKPACEWMSTSTREALEARAGWLEQEARVLDDNVARARALLACSEICATIGERDRAQKLAADARDAAPSLSFAHQQARALMAYSTSNWKDYVDALEAEINVAQVPAVRVHAALLAAAALQATRQDEMATLWLDRAAAVDRTDVRPIVARVAMGLARSDEREATFRLPDEPELAPLAAGLDTCLRLRGVSRDNVPSAPRDPSPTEVLLLARQALDRGHVAEAASLVAELARLPEIAPGALWLAASLGATHSTRRADAARWLRELAERGDDEARRALLARALELGDSEQLAEAMTSGGSFTSAERVTLATLAGLPLSAIDPHLDATASTPGMYPLAAALTSFAMPAEGDRHAQVEARAQRTCGSPSARALVRLARLLAASSPQANIESALNEIGVDPAPEPSGDTQSASTPPAGARGIALEMAMRAGRMSEVCAALEAWGAGSSENVVVARLASALVAERAGEPTLALEAFKAVRTADPTNEASLRAIASLEQVDLVAEMNELADHLGGGLPSAIARIEAAARGEGVLPEPTRAHMLEQAHGAAPTLPIASFLAERIARRAGDVDEVLRWVRQRRASSSDAVESALDAVREALLIADRQPLLAGERLQEAHLVRPGDVALRELCERMSSESPAARAAWREQHASEATGDGRTLRLLEAAHEYARAGDEDAALRCAEMAGADETSLGGVARERAELRARRVTRLSEELLSRAKEAGDARARREVYERLAVIDGSVRQDPAGALRWHRLILEELPKHEPSLRHVEQHLIGEGRDDELEPIATAIATVLRGTGPGEATAHAELAARLRLRGPDAKWDATKDIVELAAAESEASLWSLRTLQTHARASGDDATFLKSALRLVDRGSRPAETATLLVRAAEAASRLGRLEEASSLLERASMEDPGDVVAWTQLIDIRKRAEDSRGAAEASEALARISIARENQLKAWHQAGCLWLGDANDEERGIVALEAAGAIDIAYEDVFDRLSGLYASRKMQAELASVLERRIGGITDPDERLAMEVKRGTVLLDAGDTDGARRAFEAALAQRPEDAGALSAFADLCVSQRDWEGAEQALVRLARLLPTALEQRNVYARLGELYAVHLVNLSRAEVALKEVLKRAPDDTQTTEKLVDVYKRQNDAARATELQHELVSKAQSPDEKRKRLLDLAAIHEQAAHDNRRAEQTLETARREFPQDVGVLRTLAEFYARHQQAPAFNILLDRAGGDARRALASGRISPASFDVLAAVFELRGKSDAARVTKGMLAAFGGEPGDIGGGGHRAFDPKLDDLLAPEELTPALRALLAKTGDALDQVSPLDLQALKAHPLATASPLAHFAAGVAHAIGLGAVQVLASPSMGVTCIPVGSSPPTIIVGEAVPGDERFAAFLVLRALKIVQARASVLARTAPGDLAVLISAWLKCFNPKWQPQGVNPALLNAAGGRLQALMPRNLPPEVVTIALEAAGTVGGQAGALGGHVTVWADRVALLSLGDCNAAFDAIAAAGGARGTPAGAPRDPTERAAWIARTPAVRDLIAFAVTDAFAEARERLGIDPSSARS